MPIVSVLVTVFNRALYIEETLRSLLNSSFSEFDVIIIDDNSNDDSFSICREMVGKDPRFRLHRNETNLGDYKNRNKAASLAKGKYLKYLDADDLIYPHGLKVMVDAMEKYPDAALALSSNIIDPDLPYPYYHTSEQLYQAHYLGRSPLGVGPSAAIIRRECFEEVGGFSGRQFVGDSELWLKLAERWPVVSVPPALVWWRRHEGQQMRAELARPDILNVRYELETQMCRKSRHLSEVQKNRAMERLSHLHARRLWSLSIKGRHPRKAFSLARKSGLSFPDILRGLKRPKNISVL